MILSLWLLRLYCEVVILEIYNSEYIKINVVEPYFTEGYVNFILQIKAYQFCGEHNFCINFNNFRELICELNKLYNEMNGEVRFADYDSESFICLQAIEDGAVCLIGQLGSKWEDNMWTFKHDIDQTIIKLFLNCFNELVLLARR